ncbi:hypothetical protein [Providencia heimbachae]|uniref:Putative phage protein n=1 Tax=Providencia heimbachae ATCC 35613 TaxID=1354272 RepID=A0A1B7JHA2_9GAMM|nr:hypothetical protein [Providencia heimbachae]OAT46974.1 putative phage protein [Providencia heimbachae ATCC 35613]SQH12990.1 Uncharacterised protein [Providencia heimbachae]
MKERGIIFNTEMVRAILDGRKTQTRSVVKGATSNHIFHGWVTSSIHSRDEGRACWSNNTLSMRGNSIRLHCPFGKIGDRLWVRETWQGPLLDYENANRFYEAPEPFQITENCVYKADATAVPEYFDADDNLRQGWKSSSQMPRWASRITLEITDVRVERLQDISKQDAIYEGAPRGHHSIDVISKRFGFPDFSRSWFAQIWMDIYGEDNWAANPWVWVIEFKRV